MLPGFEKPVNHVTANIARSAGNQDSHDALFQKMLAISSPNLSWLGRLKVGMTTQKFATRSDLYRVTIFTELSTEVIIKFPLCLTRKSAAWR